MDPELLAIGAATTTSANQQSFGQVRLQSSENSQGIGALFTFDSAKPTEDTFEYRDFPHLFSGKKPEKDRRAMQHNTIKNNNYWKKTNTLIGRILNEILVDCGAKKSIEEQEQEWQAHYKEWGNTPGYCGKYCGEIPPGTGIKTP